jgi:hypothetical protein
MPTRSGYSGRGSATPNKTCVITSTRPNQGRRRYWREPPNNIPGIIPGEDGSLNMTSAFSGVDSSFSNLPWIAPSVVGAPVDGYTAGSGLDGPDGPIAATLDLWFAIPAGLSSIPLRLTALGVQKTGIYAGESPRYSQRFGWQAMGNVTFTITGIDLLPRLCTRPILWARLYAVNGNLLWGCRLDWDVGAGFVPIPNGSFFADQPFQSQYP